MIAHVNRSKSLIWLLASLLMTTSPSSSGMERVYPFPPLALNQSMLQYLMCKLFLSTKLNLLFTGTEYVTGGQTAWVMTTRQIRS